MELTEKDIIKVAELAKLLIKPEEIEKYKFELMQIFKMIEKLQEVKIDHNVEIYNFVNTSLPLRQDEVIEGNNVDLVLSNAPGKELQCFSVPKVRE